MKKQVPAWLLDVGAPFLVAVGRHEIIEVLEQTRPHRLPVGPAWCDQLIQWRRRLLPLVDLSRLGGADAVGIGSSPFALIAAYQASPDEPVGFGALKVRRPPTAIQVSDDLAAPLPADIAAEWQALALSAFRYGEAEVVVPDLGRLFNP
jgi:chemotaxis signal transduction protein